MTATIKTLLGFISLFAIFEPSLNPITGMAAGILGWILVNTDRAVKKELKWAHLASGTGIAAVVGYVTSSIIILVWPAVPYGIANSACAVFGAFAHKMLDRYFRIGNRVFDKVEETIDDNPKDNQE